MKSRIWSRRFKNSQAKADQFNRAYTKLQATQKRSGLKSRAWMEERYYWGDVLAELRRVLIRSEDDIKKKLSAQRAGVEAGIWIEQMTMGAAQTPAAGHGARAAPEPAPESDEMMVIHPPPHPTAAPQSRCARIPSAARNPAANTITLVCRAVNLSSVDSAANTDIAYAVLKAFQEASAF